MVCIVPYIIIIIIISTYGEYVSYHNWKEKGRVLGPTFKSVLSR